jgi:hypothetical protein
MKIPLYLLLILFVAASCGEEEVATECAALHDEKGPQGHWQIVEYGYSPGDKYYTVEVPGTPLQYAHFADGNRFQSNYEQLKEFNYYLLLKEGDGEVYLAFYKNKPVEAEENLNPTFDASFSLGMDDDVLELWFRYCIEGCHIGLKPLHCADDPPAAEQ